MGVIHGSEGQELGKGGQDVLVDYPFHHYASGESKSGAIEVYLSLHAWQIVEAQIIISLCEHN